MNAADALATLEHYNADVRADHKCPEWDDFTERECVWHVTLWWKHPDGPDGGSLGIGAGGATLLEATSLALKELQRRDGGTT